MITIPLGFYLYVYGRIRTKLQAMILFLCIAISIEIMQFIIYLLGFGTRSIDIDDVILNSLGMILGYMVTNLIHKKLNIGTREKEVFSVENHRSESN